MHTILISFDWMMQHNWWSIILALLVIARHPAAVVHGWFHVATTIATGNPSSRTTTTTTTSRPLTTSSPLRIRPNTITGSATTARILSPLSTSLRERFGIIASTTTTTTLLHATTQQQLPYIQVISDVDDTLKSSGGVNIGGIALGGIDVQYPRGAYYPGVAEFMLHISLGPHYYHYDAMLDDDDNNKASSTILPTPAKVAILTARAEEFKVALELKANNPLSLAFAKAGQQLGIRDWGIGPVLYGSVAEWIVQDRKGLRKFTNFERLIQQDPTNGQILQYVYVGDTGELDQQAGETMLREYPHLVQAVFLHVVSGIPNDPTIHIVPPMKYINGRPILYFRTYVGAAVLAVQYGLMCEIGLQRVIDAACTALQNEPSNSDKWIDINRDIDRANALLGRR